jgi:hypothetical protein
VANSIDISIDSSDLKAKILSLKDKLSAKEINRAVYLGVNVAAGKVRTKAASEIRAVYNIRDQYLKGSYIKINKANPGKLSASIEMSQRPIPINEFIKTKAYGLTKGSTTKHKPRSLGALGAAAIRSEAGISVEILKGHQEFLKGAFLFSSHFSGGTRLSVMHRSNAPDKKSYAGSFQFRHHRTHKGGKDLQIGAMFSVSPLHSVFNNIVSDVIRTQGGAILVDQVYLKLDQMAAGLIKNARYRGGRAR